MTTPNADYVPAYTAPRALSAEGARIGLMTCVRCGAALLIDPDDPDPRTAHDDWHAQVDGSGPGT